MKLYIASFLIATVASLTHAQSDTLACQPVRLIGIIDGLLDASAITIHEQHAYLIDISDPSNPSLLTTLPGSAQSTPKIPTASRVANLLYTAEFDHGYRIYDIADPSNTIELAHIEPDVTTTKGDFEVFVYDIHPEEDMLYVAMSSGGFAIFDNTDYLNPILLSHIPASAPQNSNETRFRQFIKEGNKIYIASGEPVRRTGCSAVLARRMLASLHRRSQRR
jgi:hypothetical protein